MEGLSMKRRKLVASLLVAVAVFVFAVAAGTVSGATQAKSITVWLQVDAQSGWPDVVAAANQQFQADHPGVSVNVQYQTWGTYLQKFDATLSGGNTPDVMEVGNTQTTKYMAAGAFQDLSSLKSSFPNSSTWLAGLAASGRYNGHLYAVPYYAGSRVVTYRTDLFKKAGIKVPTSLALFTSDAAKLNKKFGKSGFSPVYIAGEDWYVAMSFVYDYGGQIATYVSGKWKGTLTSKKAIAGLTAYKNFFDAASRASKTTIETVPNPYDVYKQGDAASMIGQGWFTCCVGDQYKNSTAQFVMPSHVAGQPMPGFLGGSDLAVPVGGDKTLGAAWIADFTSNASEKALEQKGNIPNTTTLFDNSKVQERAAARSWFVPTAKHWADVESGNVIRTMLGEILTGKYSVKQAAKFASDNITATLNQS
jgi:N,N'-diacetylchitobiose transport system substrate-binding protein